MKKLHKTGLILLIFIFCIASIQFGIAKADDWYESQPGYFTVYLSNETILFKIGSQVAVGDEYISENNKKYRVTKVNKANKTAQAKYIEDIDLSKITVNTSYYIIPVTAQRDNTTIGIYCTHTDESYLPSDGAASIEGNGGVLEVAKTLGNNFEKAGVESVVDTTPHDPHDAGAYRRSRQTAVRIIKENAPVALFDIHRDAIPKEEYITTVEGEEITKIRIVVGRSNQNRESNETFAYSIKAAADKQYPGLIKDIFIGEGNYNQELHPKSLLLEFGTYTHMRERALKSTSFLAEIATNVLFGGTIRDQNTKQEEKIPPQKDENTGTGKGIIFLLAILVAGGTFFFFLSSGHKEIRFKIQKMWEAFLTLLNTLRREKK